MSRHTHYNLIHARTNTLTHSHTYTWMHIRRVAGKWHLYAHQEPQYQCACGSSVTRAVNANTPNSKKKLMCYACCPFLKVSLTKIAPHYRDHMNAMYS